MAPTAFGTVYLLLALIVLPQVLAEPSSGFKKCRNHGESGGYNISSSSWGPVNTGSGGNDPHSIPPTACGSSSIPKNSGTPPTPGPTSTPLPPAVTPSTPTSTPGSPSPPSSTTGSEDPASSPPQVEASNQSVPASDSIKEEALNAHNSFRALHGADPLVWDETVAKYAVDWTSGCVFEHSSGPYGENLAVGTSPFTVTDGINMWTGEAKDYDPNNPVFSSGAGHFTQVVWKNSKRLGCAFATCPPGSIYPEEYGNSLLLSCNYDPPGNYDGQFTENVQA